MRWLKGGVVVFALLAWGLERATACGPCKRQLIYTTPGGPMVSKESYAQGELFFLTPEYSISNLVVAYRTLAGAPLSEEEVQVFLRHPESGSREDRSGLDSWLSARSSALNDYSVSIQVWRTLSTNDEILNCTGNAFENAAESLKKRQALWHDQPALIAQWIKGQDDVFANCDGSGDRIPDAVSDDSQPQLRRDRAYQIAASYFYQGRYADAEKHFREISSDPESEWRELATYLVARSIFRRASTAVNEDKAAAYADLFTYLRGLPAKTLQGRYSEDFYRIHSRAAVERHEAVAYPLLGRELARSSSADRFEHNLTLYERLWGWSWSVPQSAFELDDLSQWIHAIRSGNEEVAVTKWRANGGSPWMVAAVMVTRGKSPYAEEVARAAMDANEPRLRALYRYHATRIYNEMGDAARRSQAARAFFEATAGATAPDPFELYNLTQQVNSFLVTTVSEALRAELRQPVFFQYCEEAVRCSSEPQYLRDLPGRAFLSSDAVTTLNALVPFSVLIDMVGLLESEGGAVTALRDRLLLVAWTRSILLKDHAALVALTERLVRRFPAAQSAFGPEWSSWKAAKQRAAAIYLWLELPWLSPLVEEDAALPPPSSDLALHQFFRTQDSWWCDGDLKLPSAPSPGGTLPQFLSTEQRNTAQRERGVMAALPDGPRYLASEAIRWARTNRRDALSPRLLAAAVRATRFGCSYDATYRSCERCAKLMKDKEWRPTTGDCRKTCRPSLSKQAFQLLHRRYRGSREAKETQYWFAE